MFTGAINGRVSTNPSSGSISVISYDLIVNYKSIKTQIFRLQFSVMFFKLVLSATHLEWLTAYFPYSITGESNVKVMRIIEMTTTEGARS